MSYEIKTEQIINATPSEIMAILKDTSNYPHWNPFITKIHGSFQDKERLIITITPPNSSSITFKPVVLKATEDEIRWRGKLFIKGLFDGEHYFQVIPLNDSQSKLIHGEVFSGCLVSLLSKTLKNTERGFQQMNEALEKKVSELKK